MVNPQAVTQEMKTKYEAKTQANACVGSSRRESMARQVARCVQAESGMKKSVERRRSAVAEWCYETRTENAEPENEKKGMQAEGDAVP